eukprot:SAG31_NODE_3753_length_3920_cov_7.141848_3_plen_62_part_00
MAVTHDGGGLHQVNRVGTAPTGWRGLVATGTQVVETLLDQFDTEPFRVKGLKGTPRDLVSR